MFDNEIIPNKFVISFDGKGLDIITGIPYKISNNGNYIDEWGGNHGSTPHLSSENHPPGHSFYSRQLWFLVESSFRRGYKIFSNGKYLDSWGGGNDSKLYISSTDHPPENPCYLRQIWSFYSENNNSKSKVFQIHNEKNNCFIDTWGGGGGSNIKLCSHFNIPTDVHYSKQLWKFIRVFDYKLNAVISNFDYKLSSDKKKQPKKKTICEKIIDNLTSSTKLTVAFTFQEELTSKFNFSFNESLEFISETKLNTVIPFTDIEKEFNFRHNFEANKLTTTEKFTTTNTVELTPKSCVKSTNHYDFMENVEIPFEATIEITVIGDRLKKDGKIVKNTKLDADAVKLFLRENNFRGKIIRSEGNYVLAKVHGIFHGSYVLRTYQKLEDIKL
ncbi:10555_t:CDS:1 [Diversispora eburnea]|uniref:10555_t:CDS:1 n=1 Tax=Diversispora eburnea TaxID=1213867 RepID=A0A9N9AFE7_9GLOM|nr:10555_t:CDS:1 [Diversispora eburnea]